MTALSGVRHCHSKLGMPSTPTSVSRPGALQRNFGKLSDRTSGNRTIVYSSFPVSAVARMTHANSTRTHRRARPPAPLKTSCMALPSSVDGATTISAPQTSSKDLSVPADLFAVSDLLTVPGGKGRAIELKAGQYFKITNTYGEQVSQHFTEGQC